MLLKSYRELHSLCLNYWLYNHFKPICDHFTGGTCWWQYIQYMLAALPHMLSSGPERAGQLPLLPQFNYCLNRIISQRGRTHSLSGEGKADSLSSYDMSLSWKRIDRRKLYEHASINWTHQTPEGPLMCDFSFLLERSLDNKSNTMIMYLYMSVLGLVVYS